MTAPIESRESQKNLLVDRACPLI